MGKRKLKVQFLSSHPSLSDFEERYPRNNQDRVVVVGRSNVGKSSFLNHLFQDSSLARVAKTPGKTKLLNFYQSVDALWIDLPGYGFASVSHKQKNIWHKSLMHFFTQSDKIKLIIFLLDIRHIPSEDDEIFYQFLINNFIPHIVIFTKADKVKNAEKESNKIKEHLGLSNDIFCLAYSIKSHLPRNILTGHLCNIIN